MSRSYVAPEVTFGDTVTYRKLRRQLLCAVALVIGITVGLAIGVLI